MNNEARRRNMARLFLFGGKGGVGKTSCASSTAVWLADSGFRVLLVSSDPAHSTSDSLGVQLSGSPSAVEGAPNLDAFELDPESRMNELLPKLSAALQGGLGQRLENFLGTKASSEISGEMSEIEVAELLLPGLDEALAIDRLLTHLEDPNYDVIVFDTAPTGHTLRFLSLPELLEGWSARIARLIRTSGGVKTLILGRRQEAAIREEIDNFSIRISRARSILTDPNKSGFILVSIPEKMAVEESVRAFSALESYGITTEAVIINRVTPDLDHPFIQQRRQIEQGHIENLREQFGDLAVAEIPLRDADVYGLDSLRDMAVTLHGDIQDISGQKGEVYLGSQIPLRINVE
mgnify:CR=1 FL=1